MRNKKTELVGKQGFTLIETVISIVVIGIIMYSAIAVFITSGVKGLNVEVFTVAQSLAEGKLEEAMAQDFGNVTSESETGFPGDLSNYSYEVVVNYVSAEALDLPVGFETKYKKISVMVRHLQLGQPASLESLRADY